MYLRAKDQRTTNQEIILRKEQDVWAWLKRNLDWTEEFNVMLSPNGLSFRVAIRSIQARTLLVKLHAEVLPGFNPPEPLLEEHLWSAWFGYGEPFPVSTNYVFDVSNAIR